MFALVALHLFSAGGRQSSAIAEILRSVERLEEIHTKVQGMISPPHLATTLLFDLSRRWSLYLNRYVAESASEPLDTSGSHVPFLIETILAELDGGRYVGPILLASLADLVHMTVRGGGGANSKKRKKPLPRGGRKVTGALRCAPTRPVILGQVELAFHTGGDGPPNPTRCCYL